MKKKIVISTLLMSLSAFGADVISEGLNVSDTNCEYYSSTTGKFRISYVEDLPWGSTVEVIYAYDESYSDSTWFHENQIKMEAVAPYKWQATFEETTSLRGTFAASALNFVFKITLPDGNVRYDNGGRSSLGHYSSKISSQCCVDGPLEMMEIITI